MLLKRVKVDTANVEQGMYVSQLDRPWLETPFYLRGFEITEDNQYAVLNPETDQYEELTTVQWLKARSYQALYYI